MMMRIVKRTLGVCLIVVLASTLSILTTGVVVNAYIQSVLSTFDIKVDSPAPGFGGMIRSIIGMDEPAGKSTTISKEAIPSTGKQNTGNTEDSPSNKTEERVEENVPSDALPVMGGISSETSSTEAQNGSALDQQVVMTPEDLGDIKDKLPTAEKVNIFNILMSKLPQDEMQKISTAMEGGLTEDEVQELQRIIAKYVDPDEYETIMKMLTSTSEDEQ